ncbi:hypothetical protein CO230_05145 [Chryseobacterium sp. 6424]|uniref:hypothetical protein n=1 Tax=Chryseobacterium sp. 6424 TaxID=2039166 RepID=UPI000EFCF7A6|nr:hypothetical protein [Chryseobacterium sp. 6424]AYO57560.1 hypothetical protein CO230_05145 [Chryseobacterium sp. 6424]
MDNNNFKKSQDFNNPERNLDNNPDYNEENNATENPQARIKDDRNPEITQENFVKDAENAIPPRAWEDQQKAYNDAWENNKNQQLGEEM